MAILLWYNAVMFSILNHKTNVIALLIAVTQWVLTTFLRIDRLFFRYNSLSDVSKEFYATKALYLITLIVFWQFLFFSIRKIRSGDTFWVRGFHFFTVYLTISVVILIGVWPGTWSWDDIWVLDSISTYQTWSPWEHIITGAYESVLLQILPFPGGFILLQNTLVSLCVAYVIVKLESILAIKPFKNVTIDTFIKIIPFLLPPVIYYQFSGYRMGMYIYAELVMLVTIMDAWACSHEWSIINILFLCFLTVICASWRSESLLYVPSVCILILCVRNSISLRRKILSCTIIIVGFLIINKAQKISIGDSNYEIVSLIRPCTELVRCADANSESIDLKSIDKVLDTAIIYNNPGIDGGGLYWSTDIVRKEYSEADYSAFKRAFIRLSLNHPLIVLKERWALFVKGSGMTGNSTTNIHMSAELYESGTQNNALDKVLSNGCVAFTPLSRSIRACIINILGMRNTNGKFFTVPKLIIWNTIIPEFILICAWGTFLVKRKWFMAGMLSAVLIRLPIVFLAEPSSWFMYVLSFYFLGYILLLWALIAKYQQSRSTDHAV